MGSPRRLGFALILASTAFSFASAADKELPPPEATEQWSPEPPIVKAPADGVPSDPVVLFDGKNLDAWESTKTAGAPAPWKVESGTAAPFRRRLDESAPRFRYVRERHTDNRAPIQSPTG